MKATIFDGSRARPFTEADKDAVSPDTPYAWIDVCLDAPADPNLGPFLSEIGFSEVMTAFAARRDASGAFQVVDGNLVGATWAASDTRGDPVLVNFMWSASRLVTVHAGADDALQHVYRDIEQRGQTLFQRPTAVPGVVLALILSSVDRRLTSLAEGVGDLDNRIIEQVQKGQLDQLRVLRDQMSPWSRRLPAYLDTLNEALVDPSTLPGMDSTGATYLQAFAAAVHETVGRVGDVGDALRDAAQDFQTELSNKQGERINQLTVVSIIFLPVTFLTGYFGMNFQWLVNETMSFGTWLVLGVVAPLGLVAGSIALLWRRGYAFTIRRPRRPDRPDRPDRPEQPGGSKGRRG